MKARIWVIALLIIPGAVLGQDNRRCQIVSKGNIFTSQELIAMSSIQVPGVADSLYTIKSLGSNNYQIQSSFLSINHQVCYRVLPANLTKVYSLESLSFNHQGSRDTIVHPTSDLTLLKREELFDMGELSSGGRISRGISVGNTQDLFVNSALNLNLEGKLSDDLNIRASITDESLPYQPEGNTLQLQDFDNVFVEIYNDNFSVTGGDVVLHDNKDSYFLKYLKNVQGGLVKTSIKGSNSSLGLSSAKGQFASVQLEVFDGVSGPYKIPAPDGQQFVLVIANSEKVFLDGVALVRGYDHDYIIDYNQAEISFTTNLMITKFSRIRIDFEYAVRDFSRTIVTMGHAQKIGKAEVRLGYFKESDNENKPLFRTLSQSDKEILSKAGNDPSKAVVPGEQRVAWDPEKILYIRKDTIDTNGNTNQVFVYSVDEQKEMFEVHFSEQGNMKGSYGISEYAAKGRIYQWIGVNMGNYEPSVPLPVPTKREMVSVATTLKTGKHSELEVEMAFSNHDKNLFSEKENQSNHGYGFRTTYSIQGKKVVKFPEYAFSLSNSVEYIDRNFNGIDRFRRIEFDRDWSYSPTDTIRNNDVMLSTALSLKKDAMNFISYKISYRNRSEELGGVQHWLDWSQSIGKMQLNTHAFFMNSRTFSQSSNWQRLNVETYYRGKFQPGYRFKLEKNLVNTDLSDSIVGSQNYYSSNEFFIRNNPSSKTKYEVVYQIRQDKAPVGGELKESGNSQFVSGRLNTLIRGNHSVKAVVNYRLFDDLANDQTGIESISGRIDWTGDIIKEVYHSELTYAISNARVPRREYVYVAVPTGQGTHTWKDLNMDGLKELNEFFEAINIDEMNYIRVFVPTTNYEDAFENILNYRANIRFPRNWAKTEGFKQLLSKISNITSWSSNYRTTEDNAAARLVPFFTKLDKDNLLLLKKSIRTTFFVNRANPKFGMNGGYALIQRKTLYTNGFEGRTDKEYNLTVRWNLTRKHNIKIQSLHAQRNSESDYLEDRNFDIRENKVGPAFSWHPNPTIRLTGKYNIGLKTNVGTTEHGSNSTINEFSGQMKMGSASKYMFDALVKFSMIEFNGIELSPLGYELLQGMRPGNNFSWTVGWQQKLIGGLQLNFYYEGRKPESTRIIHTGRMSVSALF